MDSICKYALDDMSSGSVIGKIVVTTETTEGDFEDSLYNASDFYPEISNITQSARQVISKLENEVVAEQSEKLINSIENILKLLKNNGVETSHLPALFAEPLDDGSVIIEWAFNDFHLGFGIDPEPNESSWYLVSNNNLNELFTSDFFKEISIDELVRWFVLFALQNS